MIDKICDYLTNKIKQKMPEVDDERAEVINYGLQLLIGEIPKTFIFIVISAMLGILKEFLITVLVIFPYRTFSGGFHLKTHIGCILGTSLFYCGTAYISKIIVLNKLMKCLLISLIWIFGMIMCRLYAPADTENVPILRKKDRKTKRILAYIVLTIELVVALVIKNNVISNIIIIGIFLQTLTITKIAYKITKNQYGYEMYAQTQSNNV